MKIRNTVLTVVAALATISAFAALSPALQSWGSGPAQFLMTREEAKQWKSTQNDTGAQKFVDLFWARRDPTPQTPVNELKERFDQIVKYADEHFTSGKLAGSMTDRGKVMMVLGPPSKIGHSKGGKGGVEVPDSPDAAPDNPLEGMEDQPATSGPSETWTWEGDRIPAFAGPSSFSLVFKDVGTGDFRLQRSRTFDYRAAEEKSINAAIKSPNLTEVPKYTQASVPPPPVVAVKQVPASEIKVTTDLKSDVYRTAIDQYRSTKTNPYKDSPVFYGEFITPKGDYFVPVEISVPSSAGLTATDQPVFFGTVTDATGKVVASYEEPAPLSMSKTDLYYDKSLILPPGKYSGVFGLARDGKPITLGRTEMNLTGLDKTSPTVSRLIISNNVYPMSAAQKPTDPFAFGGMKVVPKGNRTFSRQDELWYFVEVRNPGVDSTGAAKFQSKVDVEWKVNGKTVKQSSPLQETPAEPLKGVQGHYAIGSSIPLAGFAPGDYTLKVKLIDTVSKKTYEMEENFKVVGTK
jgi:GWxTD domain-containing protein